MGLHDARVYRGLGVVADQQFFVELFAGAQAGHGDIDVSIRVLLVFHRQALAVNQAGTVGTSGIKFSIVRFGNVLGSRGSVLMSFRDQIEKGGPVTVTHKGVTRYFMTISEAVQLVIQAGAIGDNGEVLVLDMGKPVSIYEVAAQLVKNSGKAVEIEIVGLRSGEKVHEELFGDGEVDTRPRHPLISHVAVQPLGSELVLSTPSDARAMMIDVIAKP